jgi:signal transduction histidine kinase
MRSFACLVAESLARVFPNASVIVLRRDPEEPVVNVIGGANVSIHWGKQLLQLKDLPVVDEAMRSPGRVIERRARIAAELRCALGFESPSDFPQQILCTATVRNFATRHALLFIAPLAPSESAGRNAALQTARLLLESVQQAGGDSRLQTLASIHCAKLEWERSVDTLPDIVGLLDHNLRVLRISRAVERWQLGAVRDAIGRDLHSVLHPNCMDKECPLAVCIEAGAARLDNALPATFELKDTRLARGLIVTLTRHMELNRSRTLQTSVRTVFTVGDVSLLRATERELKALNQTLEERVIERTSELAATNRALQAEVNGRRAAEDCLRRSMRELETLSERLMNAQEVERKRISQDLHDSVGQTLSVIKYSLERAQELSRRGDGEDAACLADVVIGRVQRLMDEVRAISMDLRPASLDDLGAASAVRGLCRDWQEVYRGVEVDIDIGVADADIPGVLATNVFRAVQEALNNVARHAEANHVQIAMQIADGVLAVSVCDDGAGFDLEHAIGSGGSRGLRGLRERAESTGGRFRVTSNPGKGTVVELEWPLTIGQAARLANASLN